MNDEAFDSLLGQIAALAMTLTAVISGLPETAAGASALRLRVAWDVQREEDEVDPPGSAPIRDAILTEYLRLLEARSRA